MAWDGSGNFNLIYNWVNDANAGIRITASRFDTQEGDIATGLENCVTLDGQNTPTADLPMDTQKHTGVGNATARTNYLAMGQFQDGGGIYAATAGTAPSFTSTFSPAITAYAAGQRFIVKFHSDGAGSDTINVNGVGAKNIYYNGAATAANTIKSGDTAVLIYDGTQFNMLKNFNGGIETISVPAGAIRPGQNSGAAALSTAAGSDATKPDYDYLAFDASTEEYAQLWVKMPKSWNEGTITATFVWTAASGSGDVIWGIRGVALGNDDPFDTAFGTAQTVTDTLITAEDVHITSATSAVTIAGTPAEGDTVVFQVYRDADAGGDTLAVDARLVGVMINYTTDAGTDD